MMLAKVQPIAAPSSCFANSSSSPPPLPRLHLRPAQRSSPTDAAAAAAPALDGIGSHAYGTLADTGIFFKQTAAKLQLQRHGEKRYDERAVHSHTAGGLRIFAVTLLLVREVNSVCYRGRLALLSLAAGWRVGARTSHTWGTTARVYPAAIT